LAKATRIVVALTRRAQSRGAVFQGSTKVLGIEQSGGKVTGVATTAGVVPADIVVSCGGFWGPDLGALVGMDVPLLPLAHQYAKTHQLPELVGRNTESSEAGFPPQRAMGSSNRFTVARAAAVCSPPRGHTAARA